MGRYIHPILMDAVHDGLHRIDLVGAHHQQFLLRSHQHHVSADHLGKGALAQELFREIVQMGYFLIVFSGELIDGQKLLVRIEIEMLLLVIGKIVGVGLFLSSLDVLRLKFKPMYVRLVPIA